MNIDWLDILIAPLVGAIVGFGVWYLQSRLEAIRREQERLHDDRRKVYADVLEPFVRIFAGIRNPKENQAALQHMLSVEYKRTAFEFSLIGADDVVKSFNDLMQYVYRLEVEAEEKRNPRELLRLWGVFLLEIRRNVGSPKTRLTATEMLRSQIKDIDKALD
jgi:hypothetical protein